VLVAPQHNKPPSVDPLARHQSCCRAKVGRIELASSSLLDSLVDQFQKPRRRKVGRSSNATGQPLMGLGKGVKLFDDRMKNPMFRRRCIQIINVANTFEALAKRRQDPDILLVRLCYLRQNVDRRLPFKDLVVDDAQQCHRGVVLPELGPPQRLHLCSAACIRPPFASAMTSRSSASISSEESTALGPFDVIGFSMGLVQISRIPFRLACPFLPTMMWSCTAMPSGVAIATIAFVIWMSACEGDGSPEG